MRCLVLDLSPSPGTGWLVCLPFLRPMVLTEALVGVVFCLWSAQCITGEIGIGPFSLQLNSQVL